MFIFPGAAVEPCGAERAFYQKHREVMRTFIQQASVVAGFDFEETLVEEEISSLDERSGQLFTFAFSHAVAMAYQKTGIIPVALAGYSMGVYAAVSVSGALSFIDCCAVAGLAFDIMKKHCGGEAFAMGAVVGLTHEETHRLCDSGKYPSVCRTNTNNETCGVFSGKKDEMQTFFEDARARGAISTTLLNVSIPYHHPQYLAEASREFRKAIYNLSWSDADVPIISSIDQQPLVKSGDIADFIATGIASPVHWHHVVQAMAGIGVATAYECGSGISLSQNGRFIHNGIRYVTIKKSVRSSAA